MHWLKTTQRQTEVFFIENQRIILLAIPLIIIAIALIASSQPLGTLMAGPATGGGNGSG